MVQNMYLKKKIGRRMMRRVGCAYENTEKKEEALSNSGLKNLYLPTSCRNVEQHDK